MITRYTLPLILIYHAGQPTNPPYIKNAVSTLGLFGIQKKKQTNEMHGSKSNNHILRSFDRLDCNVQRSLLTVS